MEESKALHRLLEASDLVGMVEDLLNPATAEKLTGPAWSGMRITLRNVRDIIQNSHSIMAGELIQRSKAGLSNSNGTAVVSAPASETARNNGEMIVKSETRTIGGSSAMLTDSQRMQVANRRDLKASLEKFIDR
jgi:hypothetical protein